MYNISNLGKCHNMPCPDMLDVGCWFTFAQTFVFCYVNLVPLYIKMIVVAAIFVVVSCSVVVAALSSFEISRRDAVVRSTALSSPFLPISAADAANNKNAGLASKLSQRDPSLLKIQYLTYHLVHKSIQISYLVIGT